MNWQMGGPTPIFDHMFATSPEPPKREVVLIFADGTEVAWPIDDPRARPFVMLARTLVGEHPLNPGVRSTEGLKKRPGIDPTW